MTRLKHVIGKHYTEVTGPGWAVVVWMLTGKALWRLKLKPKYKGVKKK